MLLLCLKAPSHTVAQAEVAVATAQENNVTLLILCAQRIYSVGTGILLPVRIHVHIYIYIYIYYILCVCA